jgi:hypothetical protein
VRGYLGRSNLFGQIFRQFKHVFKCYISGHPDGMEPEVPVPFSLQLIRIFL